MSKEKLHILHIPGWYPTDDDPSFGIFIQKHVEAINKLNSSSVIFIQKGKASLEFRRNKPFEIYSYFDPSSLPIVKQISQLSQYKRALKKSYAQLVSEKGVPDVVHFHIINSYSIIAQRFFKKRNIPFVVSEQWSGYTNGLFEKKSFIYKNRIKHLLQNAIGISTVSAYLKKNMIRLGLSSAQFSIIPNVVNFSNIHLKKAPNIGTIQIANISDLVDQTKNISGLIHAFKSLTKTFPNAELHIIGQGPDFEELNKLGDQLSLSSQIKWHGYLPNEDVLKLLCEMSFYVCSSPFETFNVAIAEALAVGLPVISTRCGGPEEFVNSKNGLLIPIRDAEALSYALYKMSEKFTSYDSELIRKEIISNFNTNKIAQMFDTFYRSALNTSIT